MEIVRVGTTVSRGYIAFVIPSQGDAQRAEHASEESLASSENLRAEAADSSRARR
ncbi:MAG: hypothetical protein J7M17_01715 [Anaerolineae bacterium]|nr:hypothetical protein [Anaerolineae bacterium]